VFVRSEQRKITTCGSGSVGDVIGRIVCHHWWVHIPFTSILSRSSSDFLGTSLPQLGSCISRMEASVVSRMVISASGCLFMLMDIISRSLDILKGSLVSL
jgi:hypothetical protein